MDVRSRFVSDVLKNEGEWLLKSQGRAIASNIGERTGRLKVTRSVSVSGGEGASGTLSFTHTAYERFLDMKFLSRGGKSVRSNKRIHNRYVFGTYAAIAARLMYGLTDDVIASIKAAEQGGNA